MYSMDLNPVTNDPITVLAIRIAIVSVGTDRLVAPIESFSGYLEFFVLFSLRGKAEQWQDTRKGYEVYNHRRETVNTHIDDLPRFNRVKPDVNSGTLPVNLDRVQINTTDIFTSRVNRR